jgi:hypothetical protein
LYSDTLIYANEDILNVVQDGGQMGLNLARSGRTVRHEPSASITWLEYTEALSTALESATDSGPAHPLLASVLVPATDAPDEPASLGPEGAARVLEQALGHVQERAGRSIGLVSALELQCEAARLRLLLMRLYARLGHEDRLKALVRETHALL